MLTRPFSADPFAMLLDPERVAREVACSERLQRLQRRIYRPLDKPMIPRSLVEATSAAEFDRLVDTELDEPDSDMDLSA